jgi:hypothetical protein
MSARRNAPPNFLDIDRLPRVLLLAALLVSCTLAGSLGAAARRPFILASEARAQNDNVARKYMALKYETQQLELRVAEFQSAQGREREARSRGYLKPNETRLTFLP